MKIYTKTGDKGSTALIGGKRIDKDDIRIQAYGTVDELNSHIGLLSCMVEDQSIIQFLNKIQHLLFNIGSCLALDPESDIALPSVLDNDIEALEHNMDHYNQVLPELKNFILPGGDPANAQAHICRTVCRRAERKTISILKLGNSHPIIIKYLNRLSDYFFVLARYISYKNGSPEIIWQSS